jgi:hypothetical protein
MANAHSSPSKAIRAKCLDCCCGSSEEVRLCHITAFRLGKNPFRRVELSDAQRAALKANGFKRHAGDAPMSRVESENGASAQPSEGGEHD